MDNKTDKNTVKPIVEKKNPVEDLLKKDNSTEVLAKAIKTLLKKDRMN